MEGGEDKAVMVTVEYVCVEEGRSTRDMTMHLSMIYSWLSQYRETKNDGGNGVGYCVEDVYHK